VNGTQLTSSAATFQTFLTAANFVVGFYEGNVDVWKNGYLKYLAVYSRNLTAQEITDIQTSAVNSAAIP
jgi:hypothetical protein